jgi:hypothetical protein
MGHVNLAFKERRVAVSGLTTTSGQGVDDEARGEDGLVAAAAAADVAEDRSGYR